MFKYSSHIILSLFGLGFIAFFSACERPEKLYPEPVAPVGIQTQIFGMGENYEHQLWFEFSTQNTVTNDPSVWDIGFSCREDATIIVNGGKHATFGVTRYPGYDFKDLTYLSAQQIQSIDWQFDNPKGDPDSLAFRNWADYTGAGVFTGKDQLYLINRGADSMGTRKFVKLKVLSRENGVYHIQWGYLADTAATHDEYLLVNNDRNFLYYNFTICKQVDNEPLPRDGWDIVFTTYRKTILDELNNYKPYPYILRGVLFNPNKVKALRIPTKTEWSKVDLALAKSLTLSSDLDIIGYDWKIWNLSANKYTVDQNKIYIILDTKGNYFKMKFVDFYDDQGRKGYPKMAWELLK
ncbi:MAG: HmuY family protein [Bacteroidetes bacterium]|nr:HmuY family protein [Bacteroidota bacterium]